MDLVDIGSNTVMWKKEDRERHSTRVLTAAEKRVTADKRYSVLHDSGNFIVFHLIKLIKVTLKYNNILIQHSM